MDQGAAKAAAAEIPYREVLEKGLAEKFDLLVVPEGYVDIMNVANSQTEHGDFRKKRFPANYLSGLESLQKAGLIELREEKQTDSAAGEAGARRFEVRPTAAALNASDKRLSNEDRICIPLASCHVLTVVKDVDYRDPNAPQDENCRLITGTYECNVNRLGMKIAPTVPRIVKFRAVIKVNSLDQSYSLKDADWGKINEDGWQTSNIPQ